MDTGSTVVVGFDGSDDAIRAADWAVEVARRRNAAVHLVHALALPPIPLFDHHGWTVAELLERHEAEMRSRLEAERARLAARGIEVEVHLRRWLPVDTLLEHAAAAGAGLVVVGRHGAGASRLLLGSVSAAVARGARQPVAIVRGTPHASPPRKALLAVDGSGAARQAAAALALWAPDAEVLAVHVRTHDSEDLPDVQALSRWLADAGLAGGRCRPLLAEGAVAGTLLDLAEREDVDLIAAGRRGLSSWQALLLGGVSEKLLQLAPCPLLLAH
jgi:nucleotide-binding universal stress UspA family protein